MSKIEINGVIVETLNITQSSEDEDQTEEIGIWIPCTPEIQELIDGHECNIQIEVRDGP